MSENQSEFVHESTKPDSRWGSIGIIVIDFTLGWEDDLFYRDEDEFDEEAGQIRPRPHPG